MRKKEFTTETRGTEERLPYLNLLALLENEDVFGAGGAAIKTSDNHGYSTFECDGGGDEKFVFFQYGHSD